MTKKKYSINWENDEAVSFEVDGVIYNSLEDIPNEKDRDKLTTMIDATEFDDAFDKEFDEAFKDFDKDLEKNAQEAKEGAKKAQSLILSIFSGVALLMLLIAGTSSFLNVQKLSKEKSAEGIVADVIQQREYINQQDRVYTDYYFPVVHFTASDGKTRSIQMTEGSSPASHEKGERVTVLYDPEHPLDARIKSVGSDMLMWILPGITGILGVAFGGAVLAVKKLMPDEDE